MKCRIILRAKCCLRLTPLLFLLFSSMKAKIYPISHSYLSMSDIMLQMKRLMRNFCSVNLRKQHQRQSMFFKCLIDFFDKTELSWSKLVGVCTDGAPAMIGANSGLISLVKQKIQQFKEHIARFTKRSLFQKPFRRDFTNICLW